VSIITIDIDWNLQVSSSIMEWYSIEDYVWYITATVQFFRNGKLYLHYNLSNTCNIKRYSEIYATLEKYLYIFYLD
jgi:hypothetical protein